MSIEVPGSLKKLVKADILDELYDLMGPPKSERVEATFEIEIESEDEGTFTLHYEDGVLSAEKGMADEPFCSASIPEGGWDTVQAILQAAVDDFPDAPAMRKRQAVMRALHKPELDAAFEGISKLKDGVIAIELKGVGTFKIARGSLEEATREMTIALPEGTLEQTLSGDTDAFHAAKVGGDRRLQGDLVAALGQVWVRINKA
jgi:hypothetical protein